MARNSRISIKVTEDMKREIETIANGYGLSVSSLGAYIVGQWVSENRKEKRVSGAPAGDYGQGVPE